MPGKVSMVMPCYNKEKYIGAMLDSVIAQKWDNIKLILVNDGSTDSTRQVITEYEPKIKARGYELIVVDQENAGCCSAVKAGLLRVSGDYLCVVDADDELDPEYVSIMAGWLEENAEYDYCSCEHFAWDEENGIKVKKCFAPQRWPEESYPIEFFICNIMCKAAWQFVLRMEYVQKIRLTELFYTGTRGSFEPSFGIPLAAYGGRMKHFDLPLYNYNVGAEGISQEKVFGKVNAYWREYHRTTRVMLNSLPENILVPYRRQYYEACSAFFILSVLFHHSLWVAGGKKMEECLRQELLGYVNNWLSPEPRVTYEDICEHPYTVCRAIELALSGMWIELPNPTSRIIGYGVLGKVAARHLPSLSGTKWQPTELWDRAGDGVKVKTPDFSSLKKDDLVLLFPSTPSIMNEVSGEIKKSGARMLYHNAIYDIIAQIRFPQFEKVILKK